MTNPTSPYPDTIAVAEFMNAFEQPVRSTPTADLSDAEAALRVLLVVEEALELAVAMGYDVLPGPDGRLTPKGFTVRKIEGGTIDLVESLDALADLIVVTKGTAHSLGLPIDAAFEAVHVTNLAKAPGGVIIRHPKTRKIIKPEGWVPPTDALRALIADAS